MIHFFIRRILIVIILRPHKAVQVDALNSLFVFLDLGRVGLDLLAERRQLAAIS